MSEENKSSRNKVGRKTYVCDECNNQTCKIETECFDDRLDEFLPKYCPHSAYYSLWSEESETEEEEDGLIPRNIEHQMRDTGTMWVVETILDYGKGLTKKENAKYFYNKPRAEEEYDRRISQ